MKLYQNGIKLPVVKCKRPSFKNVRGRTWDYGKIFIDGVEYKAWLDTTWGHFIYFQYGELNQWYKLKMYSDATSDLKGKRYDVNPFENSGNKITTLP